jgi:hypothetical protein
MTTSVPFIDSVPWQGLQHAYGPASDVLPILHQIASAKGRKLFEPMGELCSRVLHQGTIYSASPPVVHVVIELLAGAAAAEKTAFYDLLTGFARSARKAIADGRAIPGCAGGDPVDGAAIRLEILQGAPSFLPDLAHSDAAIRRDAAALAVRLVRDRWVAEAEPFVRESILKGLTRARTSLHNWPDFLRAHLPPNGILASASCSDARNSTNSNPRPTPQPSTI